MVGATKTRNDETMTIRARDGFLLDAMSSSNFVASQLAVNQPCAGEQESISE